MAEKEYRLPFCRVSRRMWHDARFRALTMQGKLCFTYLLTGPAVTSLPGVLVLGRGQMADDMGIDVPGVDAMLAELGRVGMVVEDRINRLVWLPNAAKHQAPHNPNVVKGWRGTWYSLPDSPLRGRIRETLRAHAADWGTEYLAAFDDACTMPESSPNDSRMTGESSPNGSERNPPCPAHKAEEEDQHEGEEEDPAAGAPAPLLPGLPVEPETPKRPKPRKPSTGSHQLLVDHYVEAFERSQKHKPLITSTVGKGAKELLGACGGDLEKAKGYVSRCYEDGSFWADKSTLADIAREPDKRGKGADKAPSRSYGPPKQGGGFVDTSVDIDDFMKDANR